LPAADRALWRQTAAPQLRRFASHGTVLYALTPLLKDTRLSMIDKLPMSLVRELALIPREMWQEQPIETLLAYRGKTAFEIQLALGAKLKLAESWVDPARAKKLPEVDLAGAVAKIDRPGEETSGGYGHSYSAHGAQTMVVGNGERHGQELRVRTGRRPDGKQDNPSGAPAASAFASPQMHYYAYLLALEKASEALGRHESVSGFTIPLYGAGYTYLRDETTRARIELRADSVAVVFAKIKGRAGTTVEDYGIVTMYPIPYRAEPDNSY
jgi:hypothetical protein